MTTKHFVVQRTCSRRGKLLWTGWTSAASVSEDSPCESERLSRSFPRKWQNEPSFSLSSDLQRAETDQHHSEQDAARMSARVVNTLALTLHKVVSPPRGYD